MIHRTWGPPAPFLSFSPVTEVAPSCVLVLVLGSRVSSVWLSLGPVLRLKAAAGGSQDSSFSSRSVSCSWSPRRGLRWLRFIKASSVAGLVPGGLFRPATAEALFIQGVLFLLSSQLCILRCCVTELPLWSVPGTIVAKTNRKVVMGPWSFYFS